MKFSASRLQRILAEPALPFNLGDYISRGFEFTNKNFGLLLAFTVLSMVINFVCQSIPFVGIILGLAISPILSIGYSQFAFTAVREQRADFGEFFKGFSNMPALLITYFLIGVVSLLALLPGLYLWYQAGLLDWFQAVMEEYPLMQDLPPLEEMVAMPLFLMGILAMVVAALAITIFLSWALQVVWFFDVEPLEALRASRTLIARHWGVFVVFIIAASLIAGLGILLCCVGVFYTIPAMACAQFFAFADATKLFDETDEDKPDLTDHFIA